MRLALTEQCQPAAGLASDDRIGPKRRTRHGKEAADHRLAQNKPDIEVRSRRGPQVPNSRLTPGPEPEIGSGAARAEDRPVAPRPCPLRGERAVTIARLRAIPRHRSIQTWL